MVDALREPADFFLRFCECLNRFEVRYVVVGSEAVAFHGAPRYSADFDTFVLATRVNRSGLMRISRASEAMRIPLSSDFTSDRQERYGGQEQTSWTGGANRLAAPARKWATCDAARCF